MRFALVSIGAAVLMFCLLWLYPAHIFDAVVSGGGTEMKIELSLKSIFLKENFPETVNAANVETVKATFVGYLMMFICLIGVPVLIGWRVALRAGKKTNDQ